jgi:addiction module RelE/StbE family toxin
VNQIAWSPRALRDLESIREYTAQDSHLYAELVVQRIVASVERLSTFPQSGRVVPGVGQKHIREVIRPPFRIVYRVGESEIGIVTVFRATRLLRDVPE